MSPVPPLELKECPDVKHAAANPKLSIKKQVQLAVKLLDKHQVAGEFVKLISSGLGVDTRGINFSPLVLREGHDAWKAMCDVRNFRARLEETMQVVQGSCSLRRSERKLEALKSELRDFLPKKAHRYCKAFDETEMLVGRLEIVYASRLESQQQARKAQQEAEESKQKLKECRDSWQAEVERLEAELREAKNNTCEATQRYDSEVARELGAREMVAELNCAVERAHSDLSQARTNRSLKEDGVEELQSQRHKIQADLRRFEKAIAEKRQLANFTSWSAEEVARWVEHVHQGSFAAHSCEFRLQGVTGQLLATTTHDELLALGLKDLSDRRIFMAAIADLREAANVTGPKPPESLLCPITHQLLVDPVAICGDQQGQAYERQAIQHWFDTGKTVVPGTAVELRDEADRELMPLRSLARQAAQWRANNT